jgi:haloacetate dehalogenase
LKPLKPAAWSFRFAEVNGIRMHYVLAGTGPPVVLLHGWPQTWYAWRKFIEPLALRHTVIAPDLRGCGLSAKPDHGDDKGTMAADVRELVQQLGFHAATVLGHDRGAYVGHRLGLDHGDFLEKLVVLDVLPTNAVVRSLDAALASGFWHWFFHAQPELPERLVGPQIGPYLRYFLDTWSRNKVGLEPAAVESFVAANCEPGVLRAGFDDHRVLWIDLKHDDQSVAAGRRLELPVLM